MEVSEVFLGYILICRKTANDIYFSGLETKFCRDCHFIYKSSEIFQEKITLSTPSLVFTEKN